MSNLKDIRHIIVALDLSPYSVDVLNAASALATKLGAELQGWFVEDIDLLRLAEYPGAEEIMYASGRRRQVDLQRLERALRSQAQQAQRLLQATVKNTEINWSFQVTRGYRIHELLIKTGGENMLVLGNIQQTLTQARYSKQLYSAPIIVLYDGSKSSARALEAAVTLTNKSTRLIVLIPIEDANTCQKIQNQVKHFIQRENYALDFRCLKITANLQRLAQILQQEGAKILVLPVSHPLAGEQNLTRLMTNVDFPVVIVTAED